MSRSVPEPLAFPPHARPPADIFFSFFRKPEPAPTKPEPVPVLAQDNLFHPFSKSPFPMLQARGEAIKRIAPCPGAPETAEAQVGKPQVRIFILGARAESSLPVHVWEQLCLLFPAAQLHIFFIGPQVSLPKPETPKPPAQFQPPIPPTDQATQAAGATSPTPDMPPTSDASQPPAPEATVPAKIDPDTVHQNKIAELQNRKEYLPNVFKPPPPMPIDRQKYTRNAVNRYGVPSYTTPYTKELTVTGLRTNYLDVHHLFSESLDPYSDVFFFFSPGFGFPSENSFAEDGITPLPQIASPTEWGSVLPLLLESKCPIFVTGFSPADVERDVRSLSEAPDVAGQFEWVVMPGPNTFSSEKWEISDFDPRVMIKANWGIWAIRGRSKDIQERSMLDGLLPWRQ
ncbi:Mss51p [Mycena venus]|uniref:Mss51p n=1 Tax=Mycena venus TaxID=2733690 RepID=A0A8H7CIG8_9AGAR|nr:Mss51p [Mycena venus]